MGLFSKSSKSSGAPTYPYRPPPQSQFAPPPGPPPQNYIPGQTYGGPQQSYRGQVSSQQQYQQQPQQQFQQYAPPPGPPPNAVPPPPQQQPPAARKGEEDPLSSLSKYDTAFLIDDSESMEMWWDQLSVALAAVIQKAVVYDSDGVDISFLNNPTKATSQSPAELLSLFDSVLPRKSTPMKTALLRVLDPYMSELENWLVEGKPAGIPRPKPLNLIVLTDGAPDRNENPEAVIVDIAQRLDKGRFPPYQLGIQMVQIGNDDEAADHLRSLDDDLKSKHKIRDIVDTTLFTGNIDSAYLLKALLGGINKSIDRS